MEVKIEKLDDLGRGIAFIDNIVTFIPDAIPEDIVEIKILKKHKKYNEAKVMKYLKYSPSRIPSVCSFFPKCGGCQLLSMKYEDTLSYKVNKVINIFKKNKIDIKPKIIKNPHCYNYRNKISLKVINNIIGFYEENSHNIIEIDECFIASKAINKCLALIKNFNIINGKVTIRCNLNSEILLIITSNDNLNIDIDYLKKEIKLVGIVLNNETIYGVNYLFERINNTLYKISYDSFFQVNPFVTSIMLNIIKENITSADKVLELYSGVGTLSLIAAAKAKSVLGIEVVENAVLNAIFNARINKIDNVKFILNDVNKAIEKINLDFSVILLDPPRSGLTKEVINTILNINPEKIIYISCDPQTLVRDYKLLSESYNIKESYVLDMFSYTYHTESILILKRIEN